MLGVCYDRALLLARMDVLRALDLVGVPASTLDNALNAIRETRFDLLVLCGRVPYGDRVRITEEFKQRQRGKVIWPRLEDEPESSLVDAYVEPGRPHEIIAAIREVLPALG
jgi:DNA-binding response OmpR family regulator